MGRQKGGKASGSRTAPTPPNIPLLKGSPLLGEPVAGWQPSFPVAPEGLQTVSTLY